MLNDDFHDKIDRFTRGIVRRKVNQLIGRAGFTAQDRGDLERDLFVRVLQSLRSFDPEKAHRNRFVTAVVERHVANLLRNKRAIKRDHRRISSLSVMVAIADEGPTELAQVISQDELDARRCVETRSDAELAQLAQDVADVIASLPDELAELAQRLQVQTVSEIARDTGVPRTTVHDRVKRLRKRFEQAGLHHYLES